MTGAPRRYRAPRGAGSEGAAKWWTVCVGAAAETLAKDAGIDEVHETIPSDDLDDFDRAEKESYVLIIDVKDYESRHVEPLLEHFRCLAPTTFCTHGRAENLLSRNQRIHGISMSWPRAPA